MGINTCWKAFHFVFLFGLLAAVGRVEAAETLREVDLAISAVVYDPLTEKLYGAATNNILQIDPDSGQVLRTFDLGRPIIRLELGVGGGLWVGMSNAVRRFNLATLAPEEPIDVPANLYDLSPSQSEPFTVALSTVQNPGFDQRGWLIKNGILLPDSVFGIYVAVNGNYFFRDDWRYPIGPNGVVNSAFVHTPAIGRMKPFGAYIYAENGWSFHANSLQTLGANGQVSGAMAINPTENAVYYLQETGSEWALNRLEHPSGRLTGHHLFPKSDPLHEPLGAPTVAAWSTNRVAFHSATKLFLVDTTIPFGPSDLAVLQNGPSEVTVGEDYEITVTVTNRGPAAALHVTFNQELSAGILRAATPELSIFTNSIEILEPGESAVLRLQVFATDTSPATNLVTVSSSAEAEPANNTSAFVVPVLRNSNPVVVLPFTALDLTHDPRNNRLFFTTASGLWMYDPNLAQFRQVTTFPFEHVEVSSRGGTLWAFNTFLAQRFNTDTLLSERNGPSVGAPVHGIAVSPANANLVAVSDSRGTYLVNGPITPNSIPEQGTVAFSEDGAHLFFIDATDCRLSVLSVNPSLGLFLESTRTNIECGEFTVKDNLIYLQNGNIYDADTGLRSTNSLNLTPPSFAVRRPENYIDLLNRTNSAWVLRRLSATTHVALRTMPFDAAFGTPLQMVGMDVNTVAVRTASGQVVVIDLRDRDTLSASLSFAGPNQITLTFFSTAGANYRIERTDRVINPTWVTVRDNIAGTGSAIAETLSSSTGPTSFYRVIQL